MTVTIPAWLLWTLWIVVGGPIVLAVLVLAWVGFMMVRDL